MPKRLSEFARNGGKISRYPFVACTGVEKEINKRALQQRAAPPVYGKPRARNFRPSGKVYYVQGRSELQVVSGLEIESGSVLPMRSPQHCPLRLAVRRTLVRNVRNPNRYGANFFFHGFLLFVKLLYPLERSFISAIMPTASSSFFSPFEPRDLGRLRVANALEPLYVPDYPPPALVERQKFVYVNRAFLVRRRSLDEALGL